MKEGMHLQETKGLEETVKPTKEVSEKQERKMEEFLCSQNKSLEDFKSKKIEESIQRNNPSGYCTIGLPTIEFPKFSGDGFDGWVYKCNEFFDLCKTPDDVKVKLASFHMDGKALRWHKKKMEQSPITKWEDYTRQMKLKFGAKIQGSGIETRETDATPLIDTKRPRRRICEFKGNSGEEIPKLKESHPRFGPFYCNKETKESSRFLSLSKEEAWEHLLKKSPARAAVTIEIYTSAMRKIEEEARATYDGGVVDHLSGPEFRWMMIKDGCLFLQLVLCVLGGGQQLGYPPDHIISGQKKNYKDIKELIEAMFFVGNQIPFTVLKELMKQSYFKNVIKKWKWEQPSDLCRTALYELLLLPAQEVHDSRKVFASRFNWLQQQQPSDLLHGLQLLILGPKYEGEEEEEEEEKDLEAQHDIDNKISWSATELRKVGIHFRRLNRSNGSRGIRFTNSIWRCKAYPILYLPHFYVGDDTELMFQNLRRYEISQKLDQSKQEVSTYLLFMSELIRTPGDAKLIRSHGIIQGTFKHNLELPRILRGLDLDGSYNKNLRRVKLQTNDYSPPLWTKYWQIVSFVFILTILQTVYSILQFYRG
ncbi:Hypothetical predicted protein [Olea europaea subsp. europaea]|uniref:Retrotransposon gag domain-containing protein n=1 Tax=Olea europaea subsp. europaea TaxID=158383 RepID=A0A8S0UUE1_OLEEU|nr:Hypothetical predicted protein [Olea europaea subsp. europaea]